MSSFAMGPSGRVSEQIDRHVAPPRFHGCQITRLSKQISVKPFFFWLIVNLSIATFVLNGAQLLVFKRLSHRQSFGAPVSPGRRF
jgi:hypothetical protein